MKFITFTLNRLLTENQEQIPQLAKLYLEEDDSLWTSASNAVEKFINQINNAATARGLNQEQLNNLYSHIINQILHHSGTSLDIPGLGKVKNIGTGPRTFSKEKPTFVKQDYKQRILKSYQELLGQGLSDQEAREKLQQQWHGLNNPRTLSSILGKPTQATKPDVAETMIAVENYFKRLVIGTQDGQELVQAALKARQAFLKKFPNHKDPDGIIWDILKRHAKTNNITLPRAAQQYKTFIQTYIQASLN